MRPGSFMQGSSFVEDDVTFAEEVTDDLRFEAQVRNSLLHVLNIR
jgi:hypothetical protein